MLFLNPRLKGTGFSNRFNSETWLPTFIAQLKIFFLEAEPF